MYVNILILIAQIECLGDQKLVGKWPQGRRWSRGLVPMRRYQNASGGGRQASPRE